jgi:cold shock CspA family protein
VAAGRGRGRVVEFDVAQGLGVIEGTDGSRLSFHCTQLADGGREVPVGAEVRYDIVPGSAGVWEAAAIEGA